MEIGNNPKVSILIPTYNREILIGECIQSALNQTYSDFEVIIVDNASTDSTWKICQEFAAYDSRVRIFRNETNIGPVRNWLRCLNETRGKYSKILFSDDLIAPDYLARTLPLLLDSVAFVCSAVYIGEAMGKGDIEYANNTKTTYSIEEYFILLRQEKKVPFSPGAAIFRTADIRRNLHDTLPTCCTHQFWKHGAGPDVMLYALTALNYETVAIVKEPLVLFREHAGSISIANANNEVLEGYRAALAWFFKKHISNSSWLEYLAWQWINEYKITRTWPNISDYLRKHEGAGSLSELAQFGGKTVLFIMTRAWRKLNRFW